MSLSTSMAMGSWYGFLTNAEPSQLWDMSHRTLGSGLSGNMAYAALQRSEGAVAPALWALLPMDGEPWSSSRLLQWMETQSVSTAWLGFCVLETCLERCLIRPEFQREAFLAQTVFAPLWTFSALLCQEHERLAWCGERIQNQEQGTQGFIWCHQKVAKFLVSRSLLHLTLLLARLRW